MPYSYDRQRTLKLSDIIHISEPKHTLLKHMLQISPKIHLYYKT